MPVARFSRRAEADLLGIGAYTLEHWDVNQAISYLTELEVCCQGLADAPSRGHSCDDIRPGLRRFEHGRHFVFYRQETGGIFVSRVLHQRMLPERHEMDDEE